MIQTLRKTSAINSREAMIHVNPGLNMKFSSICLFAYFFWYLEMVSQTKFRDDDTLGERPDDRLGLGRPLSAAIVSKLKSCSNNLINSPEYNLNLTICKNLQRNATLIRQYNKAINEL